VVREPITRMGTRHLLIFRHGERIDRVDCRWTSTAPYDPPLSARGNQRLGHLQQHVASLELAFTAVVTSPFMRCVQTAHAVARMLQLPLLVEPGLGEPLLDGGGPLSFASDPTPSLQTPGTLLEMGFNAVDASYLPATQPTFPETASQAAERAVRAVHGVLAARSGNLLLCTHDTVLRHALEALCAPEQWLSYNVPYMSVSHCTLPLSSTPPSAPTAAASSAARWQLLRHAESVTPAVDASKGGPFGAAEVLALFGLEAEGAAHCLYLTGSRVHGTANAASDWDFVAVVPGRCTALLQCFELGREVDLVVYGLDNFLEALRDHHHHALYCVFLPAQHKWREELPAAARDSTPPLAEMARGEAWAPEPAKLRAAFLKKAASLWGMGRKYCEQARAPGTPEPKAAALRAQSHKAIAHSFRWLQLGLQLLEAGRVTDYAVANGLSAELATCAFVAWSEYVAVYRPQYEALVSRYPAVASAKPASSLPSGAPPHYAKLHEYVYQPQGPILPSVLWREVLGLALRHRTAAHRSLAARTPPPEALDAPPPHVAAEFSAYFPGQWPLYQKARVLGLASRDTAEMQPRCTRDTPEELPTLSGVGRAELPRGGDGFGARGGGRGRRPCGECRAAQAYGDGAAWPSARGPAAEHGEQGRKGSGAPRGDERAGGGSTAPEAGRRGGGDGGCGGSGHGAGRNGRGGGGGGGGSGGGRSGGECHD